MANQQRIFNVRRLTLAALAIAGGAGCATRHDHTVYREPRPIYNPGPPPADTPPPPQITRYDSGDYSQPSVPDDTVVTIPETHVDVYGESPVYDNVPYSYGYGTYDSGPYFYDAYGRGYPYRYERYPRVYRPEYYRHDDFHRPYDRDRDDHHDRRDNDHNNDRNGHDDRTPRQPPPRVERDDNHNDGRDHNNNNARPDTSHQNPPAKSPYPRAQTSNDSPRSGPSAPREADPPRTSGRSSSSNDRGNDRSPSRDAPRGADTPRSSGKSDSHASDRGDDHQLGPAKSTRDDSPRQAPPSRSGSSRGK